jgi:hypothetical protein
MQQPSQGAPLGEVQYSPQNEVELKYFNGLFRLATGGTERQITGQLAVPFFVKSKVPLPQLKEVWGIADTNSKGYLTRENFHTALRLITLVQQGMELSVDSCMRSKTAILPLPTFEGIPTPVMPSHNPTTKKPSPNPKQDNTDGSWAIDAATRLMYSNHFISLDQQKCGFLDGPTAKEFMMKSQLPHAILGNIWNMADVDKDGKLDLDEFCIAFHLIVQVSRKGRPLPPALPKELLEMKTKILLPRGKTSDISNPEDERNPVIPDLVNTEFVNRPSMEATPMLDVPVTESPRLSKAPSGSVLELPGAGNFGSMAQSIPNGLLGGNFEGIGGLSGKPTNVRTPSPILVPQHAAAKDVPVVQQNISTGKMPAEKNTLVEDASGSILVDSLSASMAEEVDARMQSSASMERFVEASVKFSSKAVLGIKHQLERLRVEREETSVSVLKATEDMDAATLSYNRMLGEEESLLDEILQLREKLDEARKQLWNVKENEFLSKGKLLELAQVKARLEDEIHLVKSEIRDFSDSTADLKQLEEKHASGIKSVEEDIQRLKDKLKAAKQTRASEKHAYENNKIRLDQIANTHEEKIAEKTKLDDEVLREMQSQRVLRGAGTFPGHLNSPNAVEMSVQNSSDEEEPDFPLATNDIFSPPPSLAPSMSSKGNGSSTSEANLMGKTVGRVFRGSGSPSPSLLPTEDAIRSQDLFEATMKPGTDLSQFAQLSKDDEFSNDIEFPDHDGFPSQNNNHEDASGNSRTDTFPNSGSDLFRNSETSAFSSGRVDGFPGEDVFSNGNNTDAFTGNGADVFSSGNSDAFLSNDADSFPSNGTDAFPSNDADAFSSGNTDAFPSNDDAFTGNGADVFSSGNTGAFLSNGEDSFPSNGTDAFPSNVTDPFPSNGTDAFPSNVTDPFPSNGTDAFPSNVADPFSSSDVEAFPSSGTDAFAPDVEVSSRNGNGLSTDGLNNDGWDATSSPFPTSNATSNDVFESEQTAGAQIEPAADNAFDTFDAFDAVDTKPNDNAFDAFATTPGSTNMNTDNGNTFSANGDDEDPFASFGDI